MYVENNTKNFRSVFIKIVLVVLVLFILMMLFPTKGFVTNYVDNKVSGNDNFNSNLLAMASAGSGYFNSSRLPQNTGDTTKITLGEMYEEKMLVKFTDSNNKVCNNKKSYILVTKEEKEYTMKVNLSCSDKTDYIMIHMDLDGTQFPSTSTARCEYALKSDDTWAYGTWSSWSSKKVNESDTIDVETKLKNVVVGSRQVPQTTTSQSKSVKVIYNGVPVYVCASSYDNAGTYNSETTCVKSTTTYQTVNTYKKVTYYRYRSKTLVSSNTDTKWSSCDDNSLINQGYVKTGKTES